MANATALITQKEQELIAAVGCRDTDEVVRLSTFPWVWNPDKGKNHVLMPDSSYAGEKPTPWGAQYKRWAPKLRSTMDQKEQQCAACMPALLLVHKSSF